MTVTALLLIAKISPFQCGSLPCRFFHFIRPAFAARTVFPHSRLRMTISEEKEELVWRCDPYTGYPFGEDPLVKFRDAQHITTDRYQRGFGYLFGWAGAFSLELESRAYP